MSPGPLPWHRLPGLGAGTFPAAGLARVWQLSWFTNHPFHAFDRQIAPPASSASVIWHSEILYLFSAGMLALFVLKVCVIDLPSRLHQSGESHVAVPEVDRLAAYGPAPMALMLLSCGV